jgi:hydrogenase maturation protein HypF
MELMCTAATRRRIEIEGIVQGVGFRPFIYRVAQRFGIHGWVSNSSGGVVIEAESDEETLDSFVSAIQSELPPLARIDRLTASREELQGEDRFTIRQSTAVDGHFALVPADVGTCADCFRDFTDASNRRYSYPFTNCTNCGPRYTIIRDVPYDRPKTTMDEFPMCPACQAEYDDPLNRRFHAEPNACPECGPGLALLSAEQMSRSVSPQFIAGAECKDILQRTRDLLAHGEILAIKGLGGFHLACDASNDRAVGLLRERKRRSGKAFAIMARDIETVERLCVVGPSERRILSGPRRPILLLSRRKGASISPHVAPGNTRLGVMVPYTPLHHLLFDEKSGYDALVMTSGNLSEEPIVSRNEEVWPRLQDLADYFLLHNRRIQTRVDDSVVQSFGGCEYPVRRSRGYVPEPVDLGMPVHEILACGGELKNTLCLTKDHYAILSPHIGDLENLETMEYFRETLGHLKRFFRVSPIAVAHDLHPNYLSTRFAREESGLRTIGVQHHHAHIASCMADNGISGKVIGVALDGTGYGTDGKIWGGEFLVCDFGGFKRAAHLSYVPLAGGDSAVRQPWRSALAYLAAAFGSEADSLPLPLFQEVPAKHVAFVKTMISRGVQTSDTSSCGRLFDAVASIIGVRHQTTYEGQAAIEFEAAAEHDEKSYPFEFTGGEVFQIDLRSTIRSLTKEFLGGATVPAISARFHRTMARVVMEACLRIRQQGGLNRVCLSGGTFQNLRLLDHSVNGLRDLGFEVFVHHRVPPNDGGLSLGQALIANQQLIDHPTVQSCMTVPLPVRTRRAL